MANARWQDGLELATAGYGQEDLVALAEALEAGSPEIVQGKPAVIEDCEVCAACALCWLPWKRRGVESWLGLAEAFSVLTHSGDLRATAVVGKFLTFFDRNPREYAYAETAKALREIARARGEFDPGEVRGGEDHGPDALRAGGDRGGEDRQVPTQGAGPAPRDGAEVLAHREGGGQ